MAELEVSLRGKSRPLPGGGRRLILRDIAFSLPRGSLVAILGPSGCGKTTLLRIIGGLDPDFEGTVRIGTRPDGSAARIGHVFQEPTLLPWRTVAENLRLVLPPDVGPETIGPLLAEVGLAAAAGEHPRRLSLGMARRAAIARALVIAPDLLLLDEPFVSLDAATAGTLRSLIAGMWRARPGLTGLLVTHDLAEAAQLADRVLLLGGTPATILADLPVPRGGGLVAAEALRSALARAASEDGP